MSYPQMRRTGFLDSLGVMKAITRSHGNLIAAAAGVPGVQMRISPGVGSHNQGWAIDYQPGPPWSSAHVVLQRIADVIYQHWDHLGVRYMAWNGEEFGGSNPSRTNRRRQATNYGGSDPFHRNHVHVDFRPGATVRSSLPGGSTPAGGSTNSSSRNTGGTMSWTARIKSYVSGNEINARTMLARAQQRAHQARNGINALTSRVRSNEWADWLAGRIWNLKNGTSGQSLALHVRRGDWRFRGAEFVADNPQTKDHQMARTHQYSLEGRNEIREVKQMVKGLAKAIDEGNRDVLKAVEASEREAIQINAAQVVKELAEAFDNDTDEKD